MKNLIVGFLVFLGWSALSTHFYVCKIKGLCNDREVISIDTISVKKAYTSDTLPNVLANKPAIMPEKLVVYFAFDKYEFMQGKETEKYFIESNLYLNQNTHAVLSITGHTDAIGSDEYNLALGYRRAQSLLQYFKIRNIPEGKIMIESKGEKEPEDDNNAAEGRAKNRRTVVTIKN